MAVWPNDMQFEIRTGGNDANGGGFSRGGSGVDYSRQTSPALNQTDLEIHPTTDYKVKDTAGNLGAEHVGNVINITGGSGFNIGRWCCYAWDGTWMELAYTNSVGTLGSTGGSFRVGGCLASPGGACQIITNLYSIYGYAVDDAVFWLQSGTYTETAALEPDCGSSEYSKPPWLRGYNTTRGDLDSPIYSTMTDNRPVIQFTAAVDGWKPSNNGTPFLANVILDGTNTGNNGVVIVSYQQLSNVCIKRWTQHGINATGSHNRFTAVEVDACGSSTPHYGISGTNGNILFGCWVHDCVDTGINFGGGNPTLLDNCWITNNGADGLKMSSYGLSAIRNTFYGNTGVGLSAATYLSMQSILANIFANNGTGIQTGSSVSSYHHGTHDWNAFYNNTTDRTNIAAGDNDIALSADPFVAAASDDYNLNNTAGGGAALRRVYRSMFDIGAFQHADPAGGGLAFLNTRKNTLIGR